MVHQHFTNVPAMTVAENVALGALRTVRRRRRGTKPSREIGRPDGARARVLGRAPRELSVGAQQRLEIVKALGRDARLLILDEPTAVLAPAEAAELLPAGCALSRDAGNAVVLITHKLQRHCRSPTT